MSYTLKRQDKTYVDISLAFEPNPVTKDLTIIKNERAIHNSLKNIILIKPSEVPFDHDFGSTVTDYLFDVIDLGTAGLLKMEIDRAVRFNEPRVNLRSVDVDPRPDQNEFMVTIRYNIVGSETVFTVEEVLQPTR